MKRFFQIFLLLCLAPTLLVAATGEGVKAWMATDVIPVQAGKPFPLTIVLDLQPGWHTYWQYPGDSGLPPKVIWHLPDGWTAGPIEFSIPEQYTEPGDMVIYGYEKQQLLRAMITPPKDLPKDKIFALKASLSWLACKELCVPGSADVELQVPGPTWATDLDWMSASVPKGDWPLASQSLFEIAISGKGTNRLVSFTGKLGASYELFPDPADGTTAGHVTSMVTPSDHGPIMLFTIPWNGPAPFKALLVERNGDAQHAWWIGGKPPRKSSSSPTNGIGFGVLIAALFSGFLGGLILNLMPCVLPVISLKIFSFIAQAGESPARIFRHGLAFAAGIFVWFLGLGVLVIALKSGGSQVTWGAFQFQNPWFVVGLSVLVFLFALNLFGVFEITLPGSAATTLDHAASRGGYGGSFFQGLFATLLATPCTAPFLGSALGFAFGQSASVILAMFAAVALGMSLPYLLLSARPGWRKWIPKPGTWMERLKQFMGFPLLATNFWLLWVVQNQRGSEAVLLLLALFLVLGFCAWIYGAAGSRRLLVFAILLIASVSVAIAGKKIAATQVTKARMGASSEGISWVTYSPAALETLLAEGKPVFLDFTASWCLTCQFNERTAINVAAVRKLLHDKGITAMKGDWTNSDSVITEVLKSFGRVGVPLAVYYPPGKGSAPIVLPELLTEKTVLDTIGK
jgi:DsbC/DsbD-like thiol-disulfide interchange protein/cytochrome c biogenesis protein CcdA